MRIDRIHIDGFGHFFDQSFGPLDGAVTVFYGGNEAGKSTLLAFVRAILFGFPNRLGRRHYPPLAGGSHGGRLNLADSAGRYYIVSRRQGTGVGPVEITTESGQPLDTETLARVLGHHSSDVFRNIFAFTLGDLYSDEILKNSRLNGQIYSAGMGAVALPDTLSTIEDRRTSIYRSRGSNYKIYRVVRDMQEIDSRLNEVSGNAAKYNSLTARLHQVETDLDSIRHQRQKTQYKLNRQNSLRNGWDDWNGLASAEEQLANIPVVEKVPNNGISRLDALQERAAITRGEYENSVQQVGMARVKLDSPIENRTILERTDNIRSIQQDRGAFAQSVHDLPEREVELEYHRKRLAATLRDLGPDWDEERLEAFDISIPVREQIVRFGDKLRAAAENVERTNSDLRGDTAALQEAQTEQKHVEQSIADASRPVLDAAQVAERRNLIRTVRVKLADQTHAHQRAADLRTQLDSVTASAVQNVRPAGSSGRNTLAAAFSFMLGIILLIGGALAGETSLIFGILAGISLFIIGVYLYVTRPQSTDQPAESPLVTGLRDSLTQAEKEAADLRSSLFTEAEPLKLESVNEPELIQAEAKLDQQTELINEWNRLAGLLSDAKRKVSRLADRVEKSTRTVRTAQQSLEGVHGEWHAWLRQRGIRETLSPETAGEIRTEVESGVDRLQNVRSHQKRVEAIKTDVYEYMELVAPLASEFEIPFEADNHASISTAADRLVELYDEVRDAVTQHDIASTDYSDAVANHNVRKRQFKEANAEIEQLLAAGKASDPEDFRTKAELQRKRSDLECAASAARDRLQRLSGPSDALEAFMTDLRATNAQAIADEILRLEGQQATFDSKSQDLSTERGGIKNELARLVGEEESSVLRMRRNVLLEQIHDYAGEWAKLTIAHNLLTEARGKFERERQPGVIQHARAFFKGITNGRYEQVYVPMGEKDITVTDANSSAKGPSQLSRGTREQLFLSLRFGLVRELNERAEPLPVVVDEVLVNFDPERALRAARGFIELAQTNQVLVFTCHPTTVELFKDAAKQVNAQPPAVIEL